jgi:hypothetical protein
MIKKIKRENNENITKSVCIYKPSNLKANIQIRYLTFLE